VRILRTIAVVAALAVALPQPALAQDDSLEGVITRVGNGQVTIRTTAGERTVTFDADTDIKMTRGALNVRSEEKTGADLIRGLPIKATGTLTGNGIDATDIDFRQEDFRTAQQINAGNVEEREALANVGEYDLVSETNVYFTVGSAAINAEGKQHLTELAATARQTDGFMISVLGYADPTGDAAANERLSQRRAEAVINYLKQNGGIQPGRVLAASAMGEVPPGGAVSTPASNAEARRVTARVVLPKSRLSNP
jgi:OmpA-OmpF porin, OOP family